MLDRVAKEAESLLGMPAEALLREALRQFLASKIDQNESMVRDLKEKYGVSGFPELEDRVRQGQLPGHPAWEDVILWEQLSRHTEALRGLIRRLEAGGSVTSAYRSERPGEEQVLPVW